MSAPNAVSLKEEGNAHFRAEEYQEAANSYSEAISALESAGESADRNLLGTIYGNRAACWTYLNNPEQCLADCDHALSIITPYPKVRMRKVWALRQMHKCNDAYDEAKKAIQEDPSLETSKADELKTLKAEADAETEKMKTEALGQLKDLGNKFLGMFGMTTDNFHVQKNSDGGYNVQFKK